MKRIYCLMLTLMLAVCVFAQTKVSGTVLKKQVLVLLVQTLLLKELLSVQLLILMVSLNLQCLLALRIL